MEISVERDKRTGKSQVVATTHLTPGTIHDRGLKVYDDGRKSVYALHSDGCKMHNGVVGEMSPTEVEEMLLQATEKNVPTGVQYHQPVYSVPYTGSSRPSTPTPGSSPFRSRVSSRNGPQLLKEENQYSHKLTGPKSQSQNPKTCKQQDTVVEGSGEETKLPYIPRQSKSDRNVNPQPYIGASTQEVTSGKMDMSSPSPATLVSVKAKTEGTPASIQPIYGALSSQSASLANYGCDADPTASAESSGDFNRCSPFCAERVNLVDTLSKDMESGPVTMIFMGYENADEEEEEEDFQAELVIVGDHDAERESDREELLSYHPEGCKSKVFRPKVGVAKVTHHRDSGDDAYIRWDELGLHKPTFIHKPGKHSP